MPYIYYSLCKEKNTVSGISAKYFKHCEHGSGVEFLSKFLKTVYLYYMHIYYMHNPSSMRRIVHKVDIAGKKAGLTKCQKKNSNAH